MAEPLTIRISNPEYIREVEHTLMELLKEMGSINVRNTPIKNETLDRWKEVIRPAQEFLVKMVPAIKKEKSDEEGE